MMKHRMLTIEIINNLAWMALIYGILVTGLMIFSNDPAIYVAALILIIPFVINFVARKIFKTFGLWIFIGLLFPIAVFIAGWADPIHWPGFFSGPLQPQFYFWLGASAATMVFSLSHFYKKTPDLSFAFIMFSSGAFIVFSFWAASTHRFQLLPVYPVLIVICVTFRIAVMHMLQMDRSLETVPSSSSQPIKKIINFDYQLLIGLSATIVIIAVAVFYAITRPILIFIARIFPGLPAVSIDGIDYSEIPFMGMGGGSADMVFEMLADGAEPSLFAQFMEVLMHIILMVLLVVAAIAFVIFIARLIFRIFTTRKHDVDAHSRKGDSVDEKEFILPIKIKRQRQETHQDEHPIRKQYKNTIKNALKTGIKIKPADTPTTAIKQVHKEELKTFADEYAKVRYQ